MAHGLSATTYAAGARMTDAIVLSIQLPMWMLSSIASPFSMGAFTLIPAVGGVCLAFGLTVAVRRRLGALWTFVIPPLISHAFVAAAGLYRGALDTAAAENVLDVFLMLQLAMCLYLVYRHRTSWVPAALLAAFSLSYAFCAVPIVSMTLTDTWL